MKINCGKLPDLPLLAGQNYGENESPVFLLPNQILPQVIESSFPLF
jgi:hypothetical protein